MLKNILSNCGLSETEQVVFLCLLERGASIASIISKHTALKRPTVYASLNNLVLLGIVMKQKRNGVMYFSPVPISMIPKVLEQQAKNKFDEVRSLTNVLENQLRDFSNKSDNLTHVFENVALESVGAVYAQLEDTLLGGNFSAIFNPQKNLLGDVKNIVANFLRETSRNKPYIREIAVSGPITDWYISLIKNPNHIVKEIPRDRKILSDMIFINGSVILLDYDQKHEVAIKITHQNYYESLMTVFEMLWESLK